MKSPALIIDLDGTLADIRVRLKHIEGKKKDWESFNKTIETDELHTWCAEIIRRFHHDHKILIVSGRIDSLLKETKGWLIKHEIPFHEIYMRRAGDMRADQVMKREVYRQKIKNLYDVLFVLDDRRKVVDMWREEGLTVLQCAPGEF